MKKMISFIMTGILLFTSFAMTTNAALNIDKHEMIEALIDQRAELICLEKYEELDEIDKQLEELGVEMMTSQEVMQKFGGTEGVQPCVSTPSMSNVTWMSSRTTVSYNGTAYEVQTLTAQPNQYSSSLKKSGNKAISSTYNWNAGTMNALKTTVMAAGGILGDASVVLTVYDIVNSFISGISKTTEISEASILYSYAHTTTATFHYVKKVGEADSAQRLTYASTKGTTAIGYQFPTFVYNGGSATPNVIQGNRTVNSTPDGYNSPYLAAIAYVNSNVQDTAYITSVTITGIESKTVATITPATPAIPGEIY